MKDMTGPGGFILGPTKLCLPVFCRHDHTTLLHLFNISSICLDLKHGVLEASLTGSIQTNQSYFS